MKLFRIALLPTLAALAGLAGTSAWSGEAPGSFRILLDQTVPVEPSVPLNVRFASDRSVYLARAHDGVSELALDGHLTKLRQPIPDDKTIGIGRFERLATSGHYLAVARHAKTFVWRDLRPGPHVVIVRLPTIFTEDIDLLGSRLLLLGMPAEDPAGSGVAWLGPLNAKKLSAGLVPVLSDVSGAGSPHLVRCEGFKLGAARFLRDGSFLVVPGFQPGVHLFSRGGRLERTWDSRALGLDDPCEELTQEEGFALGAKPRERYEFLSRHAILDEVLPLAEGPGLIIRTVGLDNKLHWTLKILQSGERVLTYELPITGNPPYERLEGDARGNRIVLLVSNQGGGAPPPAHLMELELLPGGEGTR